MATSVAFSSSAEEVMSRKVALQPGVKHGEKKTDSDLRSYYEIDRCLSFVKPYQKVFNKAHVFDNRNSFSNRVLLVGSTSVS